MPSTSRCNSRSPASVACACRGRSSPTDRAAARAFADDVGGRVVYKPLSAFNFATKGNESAVLFTSLIEPEDANDPRITLTAHLLQEWVPKQHDLRLTAVGDDLFAVIIDVQGSERGMVDWRADYRSHRYVPTDVPDDVRRGVNAMLARLGLAFGALDFAVTPEGRWTFLEINPNGQWGWIEAALDLGISGAIADALEQGSVQ